MGKLISRVLEAFDLNGLSYLEVLLKPGLLSFILNLIRVILKCPDFASELWEQVLNQLLYYKSILIYCEDLANMLSFGAAACFIVDFLGLFSGLTRFRGRLILS